MVPAGNKVKRLLSVNCTTKTIHHQHHHYHHYYHYQQLDVSAFCFWSIPGIFKNSIFCIISKATSSKSSLRWKSFPMIRFQKHRRTDSKKHLNSIDHLSIDHLKSLTKHVLTQVVLLLNEKRPKLSLFIQKELNLQPEP